MSLLLAIIAITFIASAEITICMASFPEIVRIFNISPFKAEFLLSFNLIFHLLGSLFVGSLSDIYGKRRTLLVGFVIFIIGGLISALGSNFELLLLGRMIQGLGISAAAILSGLFIVDSYTGEAEKRMMIIYNGISSIAISLAPLLGGYIALIWGWRGSFNSIVIMGVIGFLLSYCFLKDLKKLNKLSFSLRDRLSSIFSISQYSSISRNKSSLLYLLYYSSSSGAYYTFMGMSSIVYIQSFNVSLADFGLYQGLMAFVFGVLSIGSGLILKNFGNRRVFKISITFIITFLISLIPILILDIRNPVIVTVVMLFSSIGHVIPINFLYLGGLKSTPNNEGKMSALFNIFKLLMNVIGIQIASYCYKESFISTGMVSFIMTTISLFIMRSLYKRDAYFKELIVK